MKNGFGLPSSCPFSLCQNMSLPLSFMRLGKKSRSYCLMSSWPGQISGSFRKCPDGEITGQDGGSFQHNWTGPGVVCKAQDFTISRSWEDEVWLVFLLLLMLTFKIIKFQRQGKDLEKVKQRLIEIANHVDKVSSFPGN